MSRKSRLIMLLTLVGGTLCAGQSITDADWVALSGTASCGANYQISSLAYCNGSVYMNGSYSKIGDDSASGIVRWKGSSLEKLKSGWAPYTMLVTADETVYGGVRQDTAGGRPPHKVVKWSGSGWADVGQGLAGEISSIALDSAGAIVVALKIRSLYDYTYDIMKWDGTAWSSLGWRSGGPIKKLCVGPDGTLYVAGNFGGGFAQYGKGTWYSGGVSKVTGYSGPPPPYVYDIKFAKNGTMFIAGDFNRIGSASIGGVAAFSGNAWVQVGQALGTAYALAFDSSGNLYASCGSVCKLTNNKWEWIGRTSTYEWVFALTVDGQNNVWAGGYFDSLGGVSLWNFAYWDGVNWNTPLPAMESPIRAFAADSKGNLYAGGSFTLAGGKGVSHVAKWDGSKWAALGTGVTLDTAPQYATVTSLAVDQNDMLYVGGRFTKAGGIPVKNIARWNGTRWDSLYKGVNDDVYSLAYDGRTTLYAAGAFDSAGDFSVTGMAQWITDDWYPVEVGQKGIYTPTCVTADTKGNVYAAGDLFNGSMWVNNIGLWKKEQWIRLNPPGLSTFDRVKSMTCDSNGALYVVGDFDYSILKWNGTVWEKLGSGIPSSDGLFSVTTDRNGNVYAAGPFTSAGGTPAKGIAKWNGSSWEALGSGLGGYNYIYALQCIDSTMYVGGSFTSAGGKKSPFFAKVNIHNITVGTSRSTAVSPSGKRISYLIKNKHLLIMNSTPRDNIMLYSLSGRLVRKQTGGTPVDLNSLSLQSSILRVVRDGKVVAMEKVLLK
jgi:hypothetical protein